ncbi:hypothetical protein XELAEV_18027265mg [Xenopus laevis]|uniref:Uncharacterized protein n=1 Tax=Xenopus laevis TaxID=8355 RepID=A0A974CV66_XENLA|nr:hypothetical protein XELAEV_18027265mg [Xenopus laevis]
MMQATAGPCSYHFPYFRQKGYRAGLLPLTPPDGRNAYLEPHTSLGCLSAVTALTITKCVLCSLGTAKEPSTNVLLHPNTDTLNFQHSDI